MSDIIIFQKGNLLRIIIISLLILLQLYSKPVKLFDSKQKSNLKICKEVSTKLGNDPHLVCAIMLNESSARLDEKIYVGDRFLKPFNRSYGIMQVRFSTMKDMIKRFKLKKYLKLPDEILLSKLMFDKVFNIEIANYYIKYLSKKYRVPYKIAVAYNSGHYTPKNRRYKRNFNRHYKLLKSVW